MEKQKQLQIACVGYVRILILPSRQYTTGRAAVIVPATSDAVAFNTHRHKQYKPVAAGI